MAILNTTSADLDFVTDAPDWSQPVGLVAKWDTVVATNRNGGEQRNRRRNKPARSIAYRIVAADPADWSRIKADMLIRATKQVVCPIWPDTFTLVSMAGSQRLYLDVVSLDGSKFEVGGWVLISNDADPFTSYQFRKVSAVGTDYVDLTDLDAEPDDEILVFTEGALVRPCLVGHLVDNAVAFTAETVHKTTVEIAVESL